ncbi:zinc ribbon domain-containing protein [Leucobacter sp. gxy201]|uniref:zinc ribbon domain-containing protein n=1 Tax=Leucobacter sp. gxy201 TaxID=2957200 RepID=UPI003DA06BE7
MKASPRQQQLLLDLQELDTALARLARRRQSLPERAELAGLAGEVSATRESYMAAQRELDTQSAEIDRIEADVQLVRQRRERDEQLIAQSTSSKEAQALQGELDALARRMGELEDRQLGVMELQEAAQTAFDAAAADLAGVDERRAAIQAKIDEAERAIDRDIASQSEERAGLAAEVQRDLIEVYEELRGRIGIGAARLRGNVSEASNMSLTPAELSNILSAAPDELVFCPGTGAILVRVAADEAA